MNTIQELFSNYGWKQITQYNNPLRKYVYIKKDGFNEFIIEPTIYNTYTISVPLLNSEYLYKHTINNVEDAIKYIKMHLEYLNKTI